MKEKNKQKNTDQKSHHQFNPFIHVSIVILSLVILFLSYRLLDKLNVFSANDELDELANSGKIIQIEVLNGCGVDGIADTFTEKLRKKNFDVVHTGNYRSFDIDESIIIDRAGNFYNAEMLAEAVGVDENHIITQINRNYFLDVSLIIGKDFKLLSLNN